MTEIGDASNGASRSGTLDTVLQAAAGASGQKTAVASVKQDYGVAALTALVPKQTQTVSFSSSAPAGASVGGPTYAVSATGGGSGNPVTVTIDAVSSAVCSMTGGVVSFIGAGTCVVDANQAGNAGYTAAPQVQQSFAVAGGTTPQTISFSSAAPVGATVAGTYTPAATATSGLGVSLTADAASSAVCSMTGGVVSFIGAGTCVIDANQAGNTTYAPAPQVQQSFGVVKAAQTISFSSTAPDRCNRRRDLHANRGRHLRAWGDAQHRRRLERGVLDDRRRGELHRRRHVCGRCQPGRKRRLRARPAGPAVVCGRRRHHVPDDQLQLGRSDRCNRRQGPTPRRRRRPPDSG